MHSHARDTHTGKVDAWRATLSASALNASAKLIGHVLASEFEDDFLQVSLSIRSISERCGGVSESTVQRGIAMLCKYGLLERKFRDGDTSVLIGKAPFEPNATPEDAIELQLPRDLRSCADQVDYEDKVGETFNLIRPSPVMRRAAGAIEVAHSRIADLERELVKTRDTWSDWYSEQHKRAERERGRADALMEAGHKILPYLKWTIGDESPGHHPTLPSAVEDFRAALASNGKDQ